MKKFSIVIAVFLFLTGCASQNYNKEIPIYTLSIGMNKDDVVEKLGKPHRVISSEMVNSINRQVWMYQQDKIIWLTGNAFLGGQMRNDQLIYLLYFADSNLVAWKDNQLQNTTKSENTFEIRNK